METQAPTFDDGCLAGSLMPSLSGPQIGEPAKQLIDWWSHFRFNRIWTRSSLLRANYLMSFVSSVIINFSFIWPRFRLTEVNKNDIWEFREIFSFIPVTFHIQNYWILNISEYFLIPNIKSRDRVYGKWECKIQLENYQRYDVYAPRMVETFVANFDALAQGGDFRIERRQFVSLCWMQDSNPEGSLERISRWLNAHRQTYWAIEDQAKNLNSTARSYDQRAFSPLDPTAVWHSHMALAIYTFVVSYCYLHIFNLCRSPWLTSSGFL